MQSPGGSGAATPHFFLKIAEIKGDARNTKLHDGEIEVSSFSWGQTQKQTLYAKAQKTGYSVAMRDFVFSAVTGTATAQLFLFCASHRPIKTAVLTCEKHEGSKEIVYMTITLSDVQVAACDIEAVTEQNMPMDRFTLKYQKIEFKYTLKQDRTVGGNFSFAWDFDPTA